MEFPWNLWDLPWNLYKTIINIRHSDQTTVCHQSSDDAACLVKLFGQGVCVERCGCVDSCMYGFMEHWASLQNEQYDSSINTYE